MRAQDAVVDDDLILSDFLKLFKELLQQDSNIRINSFGKLFTAYIKSDLGWVDIRKRKYNFPKLLLDVLKKNQVHLDKYSLIAKPPKSDKD